MGSREERLDCGFISKGKLVGLVDGLDEDYELTKRIRGDSEVLGRSSRIWQGRLGTGSVHVKLQMSVRHLLARRVDSWIFRCGGTGR